VIQISGGKRRAPCFIVVAFFFLLCHSLYGQSTKIEVANYLKLKGQAIYADTPGWWLSNAAPSAYGGSTLFG